jgi:hypothetical protein
MTNAQNNVNLKLYTEFKDVYWVDAAKKDSNFVYRNYSFKYILYNTTNDTILFNTLHFDSATSIEEKGENKSYVFGFFNLSIYDKGWNNEQYCHPRLYYDGYKKLNDTILSSFIVKIAPKDSLKDYVKAFCCPDCDKLDKIEFRKDYKLDEKYIVAKLTYNSKQKIYYYPKRKKYWKGILESNSIFF